MVYNSGSKEYVVLLYDLLTSYLHVRWRKLQILYGFVWILFVVREAEVCDLTTKNIPFSHIR